MAKYIAKKVDAKVKVPIHSDRVGTLNGMGVTLNHNKSNGRYDLKIDGVFNFSSINHQMCLHRATKKGIAWE